MSLKITVKVGAVNNLSDARYCAGMAVDLIGFDFDKESDNYVAPEKFKEISEWVSGVDFVAEFGTSSVQHINSILKDCEVSYIQITDVDVIGQLGHIDQKIILQHSSKQLDQIPNGLPLAYLVISEDENLVEEQKEKIRSLSTEYKVLLGAGISASNVESIVEETQSIGIDLKGGDEIRPGFKDYDELADILETLELED